MKIENLIAIDILLSHKKADEGLQTLKDTFKSFSGALDQNSANIDNSLDKTMTKFQDMGSAISETGSTLTKFLTIPVAGILMGAVNAAREYESAFAGVRKTVDGSAEELAELSNAIKRMSTEIPASTTEIAGVAEAAGQLGIKIGDIEEFTEVMIALGVSTNLSADKAAESFARLFNIMGNSSEEYEKAGSAIVDLGNNYATNEQQIMNMTMRLAAAGKQAGMSTADVMGMATGLSAMGISAESGGSSMSKFISNMNVAMSLGIGKMRDLESQTGLTWRQMEMMSANSPKEFKKLADSIGLPSTELSRFVKAGKDAQQMADVAGVSVEELAQIFEEDAAKAVGMFIEGLANAQEGIESMTLTGEDAVAILTEMGITEIRLRDGLLRTANAGDLLTTAIEDANNAWSQNTALSTEAGLRYETLDSQWQMFKNTLHLIAVNLGEQMLPMLKDLIKWMQGFAENIANMDPKKFQAIAKGLIAMGAAGPALKIAGTALKGFGTVGKIFNIANNELGILKNVSESLSKTYVKGGWTAKAVLAAEEYGVRLRKNGTLMDELGRTIPSNYGKALEKLGITTKDLTKVSGTQGLTGIFNNLMSSRVFQGGLWAIAIGYAATLFTEFDFLQKGIKWVWDGLVGLMGAISNIIKPFANLVTTLTSGAIGFGDIAMAVGGFLLALNPATAAVGAFIKVVVGIKAGLGFIRALTTEAEDATPKFNITSEAISKMNDRLNNTETIYDKFVKETSPEIQQAYDDIHNKISESKLHPDNEELKVSQADYKEYTDTIIGYAGSARVKLREGLEAGLKERGLLETEYGEKLLLEFDARSEQETTKRGELQTKIEELLIRKREHQDTWNAEDEEALAIHLAELERITLTKQQETFDKEFEQVKLHLEMKRRLGMELTEEEMELLNNLMGEKLEQRYNTVAGWYADEARIYKEMLDDNTLSQEEYDVKMQELYQQMYSTQLKEARENASEYLEIMFNMNEEEVAAAVQAQLDLAAINQKILDAERENTHGINDELIKQLNNLKAKTEAEIKELNLTEEEWAGFANYLKTTMPPEMADMIDKMEKEMDFSFVPAIMDATKEELYDRSGDLGENVVLGMKDGVEKSKKKVNDAIKAMAEDTIITSQGVYEMKSPSKAFMRIGQFVGDGLIQGINNRSSAVTVAARNMASAAYRAAAAELQIKSPSRLFMKMGGFLPAGMAIGIEDESDLATKAAREMSRDIAKATNIDANFGNVGIRELKAHTHLSADSDFVQTLKSAIVEAFSVAGPIPAYIGKEEAQENFELNMLKSLTGKYNR